MLNDLSSATSRRMEHATIAKTKSGRLWYFMLYDALILATCVGSGAFAWCATEEPGCIIGCVNFKFVLAECAYKSYFIYFLKFATTYPLCTIFDKNVSRSEYGYFRPSTRV